MTRRHARPVRALFGVRRRRARRAQPDVGRDLAGRRRDRADRRAARDEAAHRRAGDPARPARTAARRNRLRRRAFQLRRRTACRCCAASRCMCGRASASRSSARRAPASRRSSRCSCAITTRPPGSVRVDGVDIRRARSAGAAAAHRPRAAGSGDLRADGGGEHPLRRLGRRCRRGPRRRRAPRMPTSSSRRCRTATDTVIGERGVTLSGGQRQRARHRPRHPEERADPAPRRGDQRARRGKRDGRAGGARDADARPHDARHRPPPRHHQERRPHRRHGRRAASSRKARIRAWSPAAASMRGWRSCSSMTARRRAGGARCRIEPDCSACGERGRSLRGRRKTLQCRPWPTNWSCASPPA